MLLAFFSLTDALCIVARKFFMKDLSKSVLQLMKYLYNHASFIVLLLRLLDTDSTEFWFQQIWNLELCLSSRNSASTYIHILM